MLFPSLSSSVDASHLQWSPIVVWQYPPSLSSHVLRSPPIQHCLPEIYRGYPRPRPPPLTCCARNIFTVYRDTLTQYITLKEVGEGSLYVLLYSCNCDVLHRTLWEDSDKIPEGRTCTYILHISAVFHALFVLYIFRDILSVQCSLFTLTCMPFRLTFFSVFVFVYSKYLILSSRSYSCKCPCCAPCNPFHKMSFKFPTQLCLFFSQFLPYFVFSHVLYVQCYIVQYLMFSVYSMSTMWKWPLCPRGTPCPPGIVLQVPRYFLYPLSSGCPICPPISAYHLIPLWPQPVSWCVSLHNEIWKLKLHSLLAHYCGFKLVSDLYTKRVCTLYGVHCSILLWYLEYLMRGHLRVKWGAMHNFKCIDYFQVSSFFKGQQEGKWIN